MFIPMFLILGYLFVQLTHFNKVIVDYIFSNLSLKNKFLKDFFRTSDDETQNISKESIMKSIEDGVTRNKLLTLDSASSKL